MDDEKNPKIRGLFQNMWIEAYDQWKQRKTNEILMNELGAVR
jgi:hypothetical protein